MDIRIAARAHTRMCLGKEMYSITYIDKYIRLQDEEMLLNKRTTYSHISY